MVHALPAGGLLPFFCFLALPFPFPFGADDDADDDATGQGRASCCGAGSCGRPFPPPLLNRGVRLLSVLLLFSCAATSV